MSLFPDNSTVFLSVVPCVSLCGGHGELEVPEARPSRPREVALGTGQHCSNGSHVGSNQGSL